MASAGKGLAYGVQLLLLGVSTAGYGAHWPLTDEELETFAEANDTMLGALRSRKTKKLVARLESLAPSLAYAFTCLMLFGPRVHASLRAAQSAHQARTGSPSMSTPATRGGVPTDVREPTAPPSGNDAGNAGASVAATPAGRAPVHGDVDASVLAGLRPGDA